MRQNPIARRCIDTVLTVGLLLLAVGGQALADAPAGYYDTVDYTNEATIRQTVHDIIDGHTKIPYTSSAKDTWDVLEEADEDPLNTARILDVYQNRSFPKWGAGNTDYNREHTWPKSFGFPDDGSTNLAYSDCHMLMLCDIGYNSSRSNYVYDDCPGGCYTYPADNYNGEVGTNYGKYAVPEGTWETWDGRKGDVARAMFYMDVRYAGDAGNEPDLILTDDINLIEDSNTGNNEAVAYMGILTTLIQWHIEDPVTAAEVLRNDIVHTHQGNRNPFVDHPEMVAYLYQGVVAGVGDGAVPPAAPVASINSIYPNPFNPATNIQFAISDSGRVRVEIFSLKGELIRTLLDENREAGEFELRWNGTGDNGQPVPSGTYFCRIDNGQASDTQPLLLLK